MMKAVIMDIQSGRGGQSQLQCDQAVTEKKAVSPWKSRHFLDVRKTAF